MILYKVLNILLLYIYPMNSSEIITEDKLLKENKTKNDKATDSNRVEVKDECEDAEAFGNPDAYHSRYIRFLIQNLSPELQGKTITIIDLRPQV
jgi:hypothetical protein